MRLGLASRSFRRRLPAPPVWSDADLAAVTTPVQLLLGARSAMHDSGAVARRIATVAPSWRTEVVPGTGTHSRSRRPGSSSRACSPSTRPAPKTTSPTS